MAATRELSAYLEKAKVSDILYGGFKTVTRGKLKGKTDLGEAVGAYKDIDEVMANQTDLVDVIVRLTPIKCLKG